jgi:hypothetical protein
MTMHGPNTPGDKDGQHDDRPLLADIFWRDEILQVMYWYQGEGFGTFVTSRDLQTFLTLDEDAINAYLERLVAEGYLQQVDDDFLQSALPRYAFTEYGAREGARRFADEFAAVTKQGHGDCPPNCPICKDLPPEDCAHCRTQEGQIYVT